MSSQLGAISSINSLIGKVFTQPKGDFVSSAWSPGVWTRALRWVKAGRLNSRVTVAILGISAGLLLTTHFWGDPITCWIPAEFPKIWADFVDQYCFVHGNPQQLAVLASWDLLPPPRNLLGPFGGAPGLRPGHSAACVHRLLPMGLSVCLSVLPTLSFISCCPLPHQIPYVLAVQAIFFYIPRFVWRTLSQFSGYDLPARSFPHPPPPPPFCSFSVQYVDALWHRIRSSDFQSE